MLLTPPPGHGRFHRRRPLHWQGGDTTQSYRDRAVWLHRAVKGMGAQVQVRRPQVTKRPVVLLCAVETCMEQPHLELDRL